MLPLGFRRGCPGPPDAGSPSDEAGRARSVPPTRPGCSPGAPATGASDAVNSPGRLTPLPSVVRLIPPLGAAHLAPQGDVGARRRISLPVAGGAAPWGARWSGCSPSGSHPCPWTERTVILPFPSPRLPQPAAVAPCLPPDDLTNLEDALHRGLYSDSKPSPRENPPFQPMEKGSGWARCPTEGVK